MKMNTSRLYLNLLPEGAKDVFFDLKKIAPSGILGGGTAVMLLLGHRKSFDLDVFLNQPIKKNLLVTLKEFYGTKLQNPLIDTADELSVLVTVDIKVSFIFFPFPPVHKTIQTDAIPIYAPEDLASNKAYVIGRRGAWRDYVDLFFLLESGIKFDQVIKEATKRFGGAFSDKLFLEQLTYFGDIGDFTVEYIEREYKPEEIKSYFEKLVQNYLKT